MNDDDYGESGNTGVANIMFDGMTVKPVEKKDTKEQRSIFLRSQYGVIVELRQWGQNSARWLDNYAQEWQLMPDGSWEQQSYHKIKAQEIGSWSGPEDIYAVVHAAGRNKSNFKNFDHRKLCSE